MTKTTTLRTLLTAIDDGVGTPQEIAMEKIVLVLDILRSIHQQEFATLAGVEASYAKFVENYGPATPESVQNFLDGLKGILDFPMPVSYLNQWLDTGLAESAEST